MNYQSLQKVSLNVLKETYLISNIDAYQIIFVDSGLKIKSTKSIDFGDYAEYDCIEIDEEVIDTQMYP